MSDRGTGTTQPNVCSHCGFLAWTVRKYGRVTHKHSCPNRVETWCQTHPIRCAEPTS